jgi:ribosomal protein L37E
MPCCHETEKRVEESACGCGTTNTCRPHGWLSRKKQAEALQECIACLEGRAEDIREYLRETKA